MNPHTPAPCPFCGGPVFAQPGHSEIVFILCGQFEDGSDGCGAVVSFRGDAATDMSATLERYAERSAAGT